MVRGHGNSKPKVFFIGDSPIGEDLKTDYALTGYSGSLLRGFCKEQGFELDDHYRSLLIKEPLPKEDDKQHTVTTQLIRKYAPLLLDEINHLGPNLLVPMGELAFNYFTNLSSIRKFRGSILPVSGDFVLEKPGTKVLPILGPAILNKEYKLRVISRIDFGKIPKNMHETPIPDNIYNVWVARSSTAFRNFLERSYKKTLDAGGFLTFDIETYLQIPICISFCFDGFESVCVPLIDSSIDRDNRVLMMELVAKLLASPIPKVNQNIKYDWKILERWNFYVDNVVGDTMLQASTLYPEFPKSLGFLTSIYTELPYFKDEGKEFDPDKGKRDRYYLYNAKDSLATSQIHSQQQKELDELGTRWVAEQLTHVCLPIYKRAETRGIRIDAQARETIIAKYESLYRIQVLKCQKALGVQYFNPKSNKECDWAIWEELGYSKVQGMKMSKDTGRVSLDEESLDLLAAKGEAKRAPSTGAFILNTIIGARKIHKILEVAYLSLHPDDRFRYEFNLAGTENARSSSSETTDQLIYLSEKGKIEVENLGHGIQNIGKHGFMIDGVTYGKDLRRMFVPSPGYVFVECDLSGAEARVDRVLGGNFDMGVFSNPGIHKYTGSLVYHCPPEEIKKHVLVDGVDRYHMSKTVRHAGERNMGPERMVMMTQRPLKECAEILGALHKAEPFIKQVFHRDVIRALDDPKHELRAPNGRLRQFFDRIDKHTYNEAISYLPQVIVSDQTKFHGIGRTWSNLDTYSYAHFLVEAHDGCLAEVKKERALEYGRLYKHNIESIPIDFRGCTLQRDYQLVIPCEVSIGESWYEGDMQEIKDI